MISRVEALNTPVEPDLDNQARIRALGITIGGFVKTMQGQAILERQELFILNGKVYQGYEQKALEPSEDQLSEAEIDGAIDVDGTKAAVLATRKRRLEWATMSKDKELAGRRREKIGQLRDELELKKLQREAQALDLPTDTPLNPLPEDPPVAPEIHGCASCGKAFTTARALNAHRMGAKH